MHLTHHTFDFMKIPDIGDVMNKFEVLGIVGEGKTVYSLNIHFQSAVANAYAFRAKAMFIECCFLGETVTFLLHLCTQQQFVFSNSESF